jgi:hypothetical protein
MPKPSTESLVRCVSAAGFSMRDVEAADDLMKIPAVRDRSHTIVHGAGDQSLLAARRLIASMVTLSKGTWIGPLPKPRISSPLALGDCPVKELADRQRRRNGRFKFQFQIVTPLPLICMIKLITYLRNTMSCSSLNLRFKFRSYQVWCSVNH